LGTTSSADLEPASFQLVYLFDVIEHLPNPVAVLRETMNLLKPGGKLLITTPAWQYGGTSDAIYHGFEYTADQLTQQVNAVGAQHGPTQVINVGKIGGVYRDLIVIAEKSE